MNAQFAIQGDRIYLLEVNPRASRTVPFISKAVGKPLAKLAVQVMLGKSLHDLGIRQDLDLGLTTFNVKAPVFPFNKFPGVDVLLGPEMKSTGEVMGRGHTFAGAYAKALAPQPACSFRKEAMPFSRSATRTRPRSCMIARGLKDLGFNLWATSGTAEFLNSYDLGCKPINKVQRGLAALRGRDPRRPLLARDQHDFRRAGDQGQLLDPPRGARAQGPLQHGGLLRARDARSHPRAAQRTARDPAALKRGSVTFRDA